MPANWHLFSGTQFAFAQALTEAAKAAKRTMLVVSVPESNDEIGGESGKAALERLKNADETVDARIPETLQRLIVPGQSDPKGDIEWTEIRLQGQDALPARASEALRPQSASDLGFDVTGIKQLLTSRVVLPQRVA